MLDIKPIYQPAKLEISNFQDLAQSVAALTDKYKGMVVTDDTTTEARKSQAELNAAIKQIEDFRKAIKKEYNEPYNAFKASTDKLKASLESAKQPIKDALDKYAEEAKRERQIMAKKDLNDILEARGLKPDDVEMQDAWFGTQLSKIERLKQMAAAADGVIAERKRVATERELVGMYAKVNNIDPSGWLVQVDEGVSIDRIKDGIAKAADERDLKAEQEAKRKEADAAIAAMKQQQVGDKLVDAETGEVVTEAPKSAADEVTDYHFGMHGTFKQAQDVSDYMRLKGYEYWSECANKEAH